MKKNIFKWLSLFVLAVVCIGFVSCGDDDDDVNPGGGSESGIAGRFQGPKRVFGNNLLRSFGSEETPWELTYNSDDFVTEIKKKNSSSGYKVSYSDNQVIVTEERRTYSYQYIFIIGSNGFAESYTCSKVGGGGSRDCLKFEYDSDGHLTKITATEDDDRPWIGTMIWQNGNTIKLYDNDGGRISAYTYTSINNNVGFLFIRPGMGGDFGDFFDEVFHYIGLLGYGTKNLIKSYSRESVTTKRGENTWTFDAAGRPTKCVTEVTETEGSSSRSSSTTYVWNYR
jgi:hypothetical protein